MSMARRWPSTVTDSARPSTETHPKLPLLPYGATKYVGELHSVSFANVYGLDTVSCPYFNGVYRREIDPAGVVVIFARSWVLAVNASYQPGSTSGMLRVRVDRG